MFKYQQYCLLVAVVGSCVGLSGSSVQAGIFSHAEIAPDRIVAVASPYGEGMHQLLVIQQISDDRNCWREFGQGPIEVDPLLVNFDFTNICGRSLDSNGYSIRMNNQDLGWRYSLRITRRDGDLHLVGVPTGNNNAPELLIGRVGGTVEGFAKLQLMPGWRMTQRTYQGDRLGHIYFTHEQSLTAFQQQQDLLATGASNGGSNSRGVMFRTTTTSGKAPSSTNATNLVVPAMP
jgi:N-acetylmuramoyl-L-alanine amidase